MTTPATEPRTTPAAPTFQPPNQTPPPPSSPPPPAAGVRAPGLGIRRPTPSTQTGAASEASATDSQSGGGQLPPDPLSADTDTPSSPDDREPLDLGKGTELKEVFRGAVIGGGEKLHQMLAQHPVEREERLWLLKSERQAASIADPAANIAARHAGTIAVDNDMADAIKGGLALLAYLVGNVVKAFTIRRALRDMARSAPGFDTPQPEGASE